MEDNKGNTNLHMSLKKNKKFLSKYLININQQYNEIVNFELDRPIHIACRYERENEIKDLLNNNVNINVKNNLGETPLMIACIINNLNIVKILIDHDANVNILTYSNKNLLQLVYSMKNVFNDNTNLFIYLIHHSNINHRDISGNTICHYICRYLDLRFFEFLEKYNLNYNITNNNKRNLLFELIIGYNNIIAKDIYLDIFNILFNKLIDNTDLFIIDYFNKLVFRYSSNNDIKNKIINKIAQKIDNILINNNINIPVALINNIIDCL